MEAHTQRVQEIVEQLKNRPADKLVSIRKKTPHHQIHDLSWKDKCYRVDVSSLNNIIRFEEGKDRLGNPCTLIVAEGQVTMEELAVACLDRGLLPHTVPEYSNFTVAGLINGEGIQSSSFRYGVFSHTVVEMEVILGDGSVVTCNTEKDAHLFSHLPESMGTLGIVTLAKIACRRATPWVLTTYELFNNVTEFTDRVSALCRCEDKDKDDFFEGLVCSNDAYLVIRSNFVPSPPQGVPEFYPQHHDTEKGDLWYYQYVRYHVLKDNFSRIAIPQDVIPSNQFLFRGMRGVWWILEMHLNSKWLCDQSWMRKLCDKKAYESMNEKGFASTDSLLSREDEERCTVFQDIGINLSRLKEGIEWTNKNLAVYPLWICPVDSSRHLKTKEHLHGPPGDDYIVDVGIYGEPQVDNYLHNRVMPALQKMGDSPSTWGMSYFMSREELKQKCEPIRQRYHAIGTFVAIEDKIRYPKENPDLDEKPITCWRLHRDYGKHWWIKLPLFLAIFIAVLVFISVMITRFTIVKLSSTGSNVGAATVSGSASVGASSSPDL